VLFRRWRTLLRLVLGVALPGVALPGVAPLFDEIEATAQRGKRAVGGNRTLLPTVVLLDVADAKFEDGAPVPNSGGGRLGGMTNPSASERLDVGAEEAGPLLEAQLGVDISGEEEFPRYVAW